MPAGEREGRSGGEDREGTDRTWRLSPSMANVRWEEDLRADRRNMSGARNSDPSEDWCRDV